MTFQVRLAVRSPLLLEPVVATCTASYTGDTPRTYTLDTRREHGASWRRLRADGPGGVLMLYPTHS